MYNSPVPLIIIHPDVHSLIKVNDRLLGECSPSSFTALPISDSGDYYISAVPLYSESDSMHYSVTRKLSFDGGNLSCTLADDVKLCLWPGGVFELFIQTGRFPKAEKECFPYTLSSMVLDRMRELTLYYENGLKLAVTSKNAADNCAFSLGRSASGRLESVSISGHDYIAVFTDFKGKERLFLFDKQLNNVLDICADSISIKGGACIETLDLLNTALGHQKRTLFIPVSDTEFKEEFKGTGFFSHEYAYPDSTLTLSTAFCEAVRENLEQEALSYLCDELLSVLDFAAVKEFLGSFDSVRPPLSVNDGTLLGLVSRDSNTLLSARLFTFSFDGLKISDISEY